MENIEETKKSGFNKYFAWLMAVFCFVGIPAIMLFYSVYRFFQTDEDQILYNLKSNMQNITSEIKRNMPAEKYFCRLLLDFNLSERWTNEYSSDELKCQKLCNSLKETYGDDIDFLIIKNNGNITYNTTNYKHSKKDWLLTYFYVKKNCGLYSEKLCPERGSIESARKVLGPQMVQDSIRTVYDSNIFGFFWVDTSKSIRPSAVYAFPWGGLFVFASRELLNGMMHVRQLSGEYAKEHGLTVGVYDFTNIDNDFWCNESITNVEDLKRSLVSSENEGKTYKETKDYYVFHRVLTNNMRICLVGKKKNSDLDIFFKALMAFLLYCILSWPIIIYGWNTIVLGVPGNASIKLKLAFLFFFATGVPLLSLAIISNEYKMHRKIALMEDAKNWSVDNLIRFDQRYLSYLKKISEDYDEFIDKWSEKLKTKPFSYLDSIELGDGLAKYKCSDYYLLASEAKYIGAPDGFFRYSGALDTAKFDEQNSIFYNGQVKSYRYNDIRMINIVVKKLCSDLNGTEIPGYILSKLELVAENILQKSFSEIIYSVIETLGVVKEWGFGKNLNMTYFKFVSLGEKSKTDYVVVAAWRPRDIQADFVNSIIDQANRNPENFKFIAYELELHKFIPKSYTNNNEITRFAQRAEQKPTDEIEIINYNGEDYIAVSFKGRELYRYSLVGLYPMRNINSVIYKQSSILWILGVLCMILAAGLAQLLAKSFVKPLHVLREGALAIENRNFKYRLSKLEHDEFGEVGGIFNNVMVGLEELEVAKIVQESMFPKPVFEQGKFSIYGKSVTMIDVGGDYLDFFKVDDNSFSVLLGDVAGHGVGAAVIMAMAKAAILGGGESLKSPAAVLNQLHKMILATKNSKQRKIMTFQYLHVNSETGENLYSNAGACSPFLVRHSENAVEELKVAGAALGAFKKAVYKETPLNIQPGDAIIFYTDGIVECKDPNGEMLGYDRLKQLLLKSWDAEAEKYYNNIINAYNEFVGSEAEAGDDLTIVILMYKEQEETLIEDNTGAIIQ